MKRGIVDRVIITCGGVDRTEARTTATRRFVKVTGWVQWNTVDVAVAGRSLELGKSNGIGCWRKLNMAEEGWLGDGPRHHHQIPRATSAQRFQLDSLIARNNKGQFACDLHRRWCSRSRKLFCLSRCRSSARGFCFPSEFLSLVAYLASCQIESDLKLGAHTRSASERDNATRRTHLENGTFMAAPWTITSEEKEKKKKRSELQAASSERFFMDVSHFSSRSSPLTS